VSTLFYVDTSFTTDGQRVSPWFIERLLKTASTGSKRARLKLLASQSGIPTMRSMAINGRTTTLLTKYG